MRDTIESDLLTAGDDDLLTTGEAARLLNSSRQHVVDLCDRGDLPFVTVGTHRRVRRGDVEAVRHRSARLTRDQRRSLWLSFAIAGRIAADPDHARALARDNLATMRTAARGATHRWLDEWARLLDRPILELLATLTARTPRARELRQSQPFAGLLTDAERKAVLSAWTAEEEAGRR